MYRAVLYLRGIISMIHVHKIMRIAPPPETDLNDLIKFEEGAEDTFLIQEEGVSL